MKILYDFQVFAMQDYGGISRYFFELFNYFYDNKQIEFELPLMLSNNHYLKNFSPVDYRHFFQEYPFFGKRTFIKSVDKIYSINRIRKNKYDIFHPTYYDAYFLSHIGNKPFIITVYDLIHEIFDKKYAYIRKGKRKDKKLLLNKATKIIAISENTKKDLIDIFHIDESKIEVIYLATSFNTSGNGTPQKKYINVPGQYILYVGERAAYKNFDLFVKAVAPTLKRYNLFLVCAGGAAFSHQEFSLCSSINIIDRVKHFKFKSDNELISLYTNAELFVLPSLYEGFGIPVLEAFSCGCPVLLSRTSSLPEVGGIAAVYFDPTDPDSIADSIERVLNDQELRTNMKIRGKEQLTNFSWEKTSQQTIRLYNSIQ